MASLLRPASSMPTGVHIVLQNLHDGHYLNLRGNWPQIGTWVQLWEDIHNFGNHWKLVPASGANDAFYICHRLNEDLCLGADTGRPATLVDASVSAICLILVAKSDPSAKWLFRTDGNGRFVVGNAAQTQLLVDGEMVFPILSRQLLRTADHAPEYDFLDRAKGARAVALCMPSKRNIAAISEWQLFRAPDPAPQQMPRTISSLCGPTEPAALHSAAWLKEQAEKIPQTYVLQHVSSTLYLNVLGSRPWPGRKVHLWDDATNQGNHWKLVPTQLNAYEYFIVPVLDTTLCLGLHHGWQMLELGAATKLLSPLDPSARWLFRVDVITGQTTLDNFMPLVNADGLSSRAYLQTAPGYAVTKWTQPTVLNVPAGNFSAWNVVLLPQSDLVDAEMMAACPPRLEEAELCYCEPQHQAGSSSSSQQVPLPPRLEPEKWRGYIDEQTQIVWFATPDNQWQSDGDSVEPYVEII